MSIVCENILYGDDGRMSMKEKKRVAISKADARNYLLRYHHLTDDTALAHGDVEAYVRKVGCVQFDPIDVVGFNSDLVLQSRVAGYRRGDVEEHLYERRRLFDAWDKNMSICSVEDWPCFARTRRHAASRIEGLARGVEIATAYLHEHEYASSADFDAEEMNEKIHWYWGSHRLAKAALEYMCHAGLAVVHHRQGSRRFFCLAENFIPADILRAPDPNADDGDFRRWLVRRRIDAVGLLWNRGGDAWLGTIDFKSEHRNGAFDALLAEGTIAAVEVEGVKHPVYISAGNLPLLEAACGAPPVPRSNVRIIAALDNLVWERKLLRELWDFDYKWEVYVPAGKRQYGYYTLPVLAGDRFVGRIELRTERPSAERRTLKAISFWREESAKRTDYSVADLRKSLARFARYNRCGDLAVDCGLK